MDIDAAENVYITGFTQGSYPITPGTYGTPNSSGGYFIHKLNPSLTTTLFSTHLGAHSLGNQPVPTAFQTTGCGNIYFAGYGLTNSPLSSDALERNRKTMYVCQLSNDGKQLVYGSYLGGNDNSPHPHQANTSLITEAGTLYQIECTYSTTQSVTPGAYDLSFTGSPDAAVSKFQFTPVKLDQIKAQAVVPPPSCAPYPVQFKNTTAEGVTYSWNFGDGTPESGAVNPSHTFEKSGKYRVRLIAFNPNVCQLGDTTFLEVEVLGPPVSALPDQVAYLCNSTVTLDAGNPGYTYLWSTGETTQTISVTQKGEYKVKISLGYCEITDSITVENPLLPVEAPNIITPNQDGKNDLFVIKNTAPGTQLKIYNRWGNLVFKDDDYQNTWNGKNLSKGTYFYHVQSPGSCTTEKGWVEIVQ